MELMGAITTVMAMLEEKVGLGAEHRHAYNLNMWAAKGLPAFDADLIPLRRVINLLHHPNFMWTCPGLGVTKLKYMELRVDTRDCACLVKDRDGRAVTPQQLEELERTLSNFNGTFASMNDNPELALLPANTLNVLQRVSAAAWALLNDPATVVTAEARRALVAAMKEAGGVLVTGEGSPSDQAVSR